jgi:hypothetical protein
MLARKPRHTTLFVIAILLSLPGALAEPTRAVQAPSVNTGDLKPITVAAVDAESGAPVTAFTYQAWFEAPGRKSPRNRDVWTAVTSPAGTFVVQAPAACRLYVAAKAPDYIRNFPLVDDLVIRSVDNPRRVVIQLRRGITVRGTVRDTQTKEPIALATVAPLFRKYTLGWEPDEDKQVVTGTDGRYLVRGVDPEMGVTAKHADYDRVYDREFGARKPTSPDFDIFLKRAPKISVTVVDLNGKPLEGVTADDLNRTQAASGKDRRLALKVAGYSALTFHKDGFIDKKVELDEIFPEAPKPGALVVVMEPSIPLAVHVVAPDGQPVTKFTVAAGPGKLPADTQSVRRDVQSRDGRGSVNLSKKGTTWVGIAATGFAVWEGLVEVKRGGSPLEVRLSPGVAVTARVVVTQPLLSSIKATLVPRRDRVQVEIPGFDENIALKQLATRTASLSADGSLRFDFVRPDRYELTIQGEGDPETALALDVPGAGLDAGTIRIDVPTTFGRVEGRIWRPKPEGGDVWAFADGFVGQWNNRFLTDEDGRFAMECVPAGLTTVEFPYQTFCVIDHHTWSVLVVEGQTTVVRAFDPGERREFTLAFAIGDRSEAQYQSGTGLGASRKVDNVTVSSRLLSGYLKGPVTPRKPMFRVDLVPLSKSPVSFARPDWEELDAERKVVLPDVGPGTYRLRIYDWLGSRDLDSGPLFDQTVVVPPGGRGEVSIPLGGGCITGKIPAPKDNFHRPVEVTAVARGASAPYRRTRCDDDGTFCVRYLAPGVYTLWIHDPKAGFCRVDNVRVPAGVVDVGERVLSAGSTISGSIHFVRRAHVPKEIVAVGPSGVAVRRAFPPGSSVDHFKFDGLWPGHWTISARSVDEVVAAAGVDIGASGTFLVTLTTGHPPGL